MPEIKKQNVESATGEDLGTVSHIPLPETLEEAAKKHSGIAYNRQDYEEQYYNPIGCIKYDSFIEGAKWQAERMYSEEDMREAFIAGGNSCIEEDDDYGSAYDAYMEDWFEQFKRN
jgi:hypothetical protein